MIPYRFYRLDRSNHISGPPLEKDCLDDEEAIGEALRVVNGQDIEVWHAARLVARLDSRKKAALLDEAVSDFISKSGCGPASGMRGGASGRSAANKAFAIRRSRHAGVSAVTDAPRDAKCPHIALGVIEALKPPARPARRAGSGELA